MSVMRNLALVLSLAVTPAIAQAPLKPVKVITARAGGADVTRQFFGHVVARETVDLAFQVGGQVVEFPVIEGAILRKGDLVAQLDLETFELSLEQAQLQKDQAERTLNRLKRLSESTASQVRIDDAATQLALAEVTVKNAEYALKHATLSAPFDALVAARNIANYTTISAGTPVVRLHDMSEVHIEVDIPEVLFLRAEESSNVEISARFPASDEVFPLRLREFNAETSKVGQSYRVTLAMTPPSGLRILPGASATVIAVLQGDHTDAIQVPKTAVFVEDTGKPAVMVFSPDDADTGTLRKQAVEIARSPEDGILILSGLAAGTEIVAAGGAALKDGQAVRRFTGFGN